RAVLAAQILNTGSSLDRSGGACGPATLSSSDPPARPLDRVGGADGSTGGPSDHVRRDGSRRLLTDHAPPRQRRRLSAQRHSSPRRYAEVHTSVARALPPGAAPGGAHGSRCMLLRQGDGPYAGTGTGP